MKFTLKEMFAIGEVSGCPKCGSPDCYQEECEEFGDADSFLESCKALALEKGMSKKEVDASKFKYCADSEFAENPKAMPEEFVNNMMRNTHDRRDWHKSARQEDDGGYAGWPREKDFYGEDTEAPPVYDTKDEKNIDLDKFGKAGKY